MTSQNLVSYMLKSDTAAILGLFEYTVTKGHVSGKDILADCIKLKKITDKYGVPSIDSAGLHKDRNEANIVSIPIMVEDDSLLNLKRCVLHVAFYPDRFLVSPKKIIDYSLVMTPLVRPKQEFIILPEQRKTATK